MQGTVGNLPHRIDIARLVEGVILKTYRGVVGLSCQVAPEMALDGGGRKLQEKVELLA